MPNATYGVRHKRLLTICAKYAIIIRFETNYDWSEKAMRVTTSYSSVLMTALHHITEGDISTADLLINNHYHQQKHSTEDFVHLLRLTASHRAYVEASDSTKNELARILFLLDKKHNRPGNSIYVDFRKEVAEDGTVTVLFTIKEKKSTPAH